MNIKIPIFIKRADDVCKKYRWALVVILVAECVIFALLRHVKEIQIFTR